MLSDAITIERVTVRLSDLFDDHAKTAAAAGVTALLGDCDPSHALKEAAERLRCIRLSKLTRAEVANNQPLPELFTRTERSKIGGIDAFVSHSWHDDPDGKWEALSAWCAAFEAEHGREPRLWFDSATED